MTEFQIETYRNLLNALKQELTLTLIGLESSTAPVSPDNSIGRLTRQDAMLSQQVALEMRRRNEGRLQQVEYALQRLSRGEYGVCLRCEEDISEARLNVRPEAQTCIQCAQKGR